MWFHYAKTEVGKIGAVLNHGHNSSVRHPPAKVEDVAEFTASTRDGQEAQLGHSAAMIKVVRINGEDSEFFEQWTAGPNSLETLVFNSVKDL